MGFVRLNSGVGKAVLPSEALGDNPFSVFFQLPSRLHCLAPGSITPTSASVVASPPLFVLSSALLSSRS